MSWTGNHRRLYLLTAISFLFLSSIYAGESDRLQPSATSLASSERPLSDPVVGEAVGKQYSQNVASNGDAFLVVWADERSFRDDGAPFASLFATRVSLQGELLDPTGILISTDRGAIDPPTVVWNGRDYVVAWTEGSAGYVALISVTGIVQPAGGKRIAEVPFDSLTVAASNGSNTLVYYVGPGYGLQPAYLVAQGFVLDQETNVLRSHTLDVSTRRDFAVETNGTSYIAGALLQPSLKTWAIDSSGNLGGENIIMAGGTAASSSTLEIASNGSEYLAVFPDNGEFAAARLTSEGALAEPPKRFAATNELVPHMSQYALTWQRDHYALDFMAVVRTVACFPTCDPGIYDLRQIRLERDGSRANTTVVTLSARQGSERVPQTAVANDVSLVVWNLDYRGVSATLMLGGTPVSEVVVSRSVAGQRDASVTSNGSVYLATWLEERGSLEDARLLSGRFDSAGIPLDGPGVEIPPSEPEAVHIALSAASDGTNFIVVWLELLYDEQTGRSTQQVLGRRILASGRPDGAPIVLVSPTSEVITNIIVTFDSNSYLLFWSGDLPGRTVRFARATRIGRDGNVAETVELPQEAQGMREVNSEGASHFLLTSDYTGLRAVFLSRSLTLERSLEIVSREFVVLPARVAFNGSMYFVIWSASPSGVSLLRASRITITGQLLDGPAGQLVANTFSSQTSPVVAWDGRQFLIRWLDGLNDTNDIVGIELSPDQALSPNPGFARVLVPRADAFSLSFLVIPPGMKGILGYRKLHPEHRVPRSFLRRDFVVTRSRAVRR